MSDTRAVTSTTAADLRASADRIAGPAPAWARRMREEADRMEVMPDGPVSADDRSAPVTGGSPRDSAYCPGRGGPHRPLRLVIIP